MGQELALAVPTTEEMTRVGIVGAAAGVTGAVEGVVMSMVAPKLGALELPFTWGTLLGIPVIGAAAALMTKGFLSDIGIGIAAGGAALLGREMPVMLQEFTLAKAPRQIGNSGGVKQLSAGPLGAAQRAQAAVRSVMEF
ncbi:hypothetical protein ES703_53608 [subsurface metagenome]